MTDLDKNIEKIKELLSPNYFKERGYSTPNQIKFIKEIPNQRWTVDNDYLDLTYYNGKCNGGI